MSRFSEEMKIIPRTAWAIAIVLSLGLPLLLWIYWTVAVQTGGSSWTPPLPIIFTGTMMGISIFFFVLLVGYIAGDARRRGMRVVLWVLLAIFIPNAIGIILYFILRHPLLRDCPQCGARTNPAFAFCPSCGAAITTACPSCRSAVEPGWSHCARCGVALSKS